MPTATSIDRFVPTPHAEGNARIIHALVSAGWSAQAQAVARDLQFLPVDLIGPTTLASLADHAARAETGRKRGARFDLARARFLAAVDAARGGRDEPTPSAGGHGA